jgi:hypothetical protein
MGRQVEVNHRKSQIAMVEFTGAPGKGKLPDAAVPRMSGPRAMGFRCERVADDCMGHGSVVNGSGRGTGFGRRHGHHDDIVTEKQRDQQET